MPILKWFPPQGAPRTFVLYKPVTTVGRALGNDVAIPTSGVAATHVQDLVRRPGFQSGGERPAG